jgi:predicted TIM-barrel fold metal-dependent hydrolase
VPIPARSGPSVIDCHVHVFCRDARFAADAPYVPHPAQMGDTAQLGAVLAAAGISNCVLVSAQPYGCDNSCMLQALKASNGRDRGIALVRAEISDRELDALGDQGVVGIRMNLSSFGLREVVGHEAEELLARISERGWLLQLHAEGDLLAQALPAVTRHGVRLLIDHCGRPDPARGLNYPGFAALLELGRTGHFLKLSAPFRSSTQPYPYADLDPFLSAAIDAFTLDRCVWGSDWPFVKVTERVDYGPMLSFLERWVPDQADRRRILLDNPVRLFGFDAPTGTGSTPDDVPVDGD